MRVHAIDRFDHINNPAKYGGEGMSFTIWFAGCTFNCPGCQNAALQTSEGIEMSYMDILRYIDIAERKTGYVYKDIVLTGGEPLQQDQEELRMLIKVLNESNIRVWLYTGYSFESIPVDIVDMVYLIKSGLYISELATGKFPASSNQKIYIRTQFK